MPATTSAPTASTVPEALSSPASLNTFGRLTSLDAYRGFVMLLMASGGLGIHQVAQNLEGNKFWEFLAYQTEHVGWIGCTLWDLIQPSFMFMVGTAMAFSMASRQARGQPFGQMLLHAVGRALALIFLGVFLRSLGEPQTYFTFEDVTSQIGLGYVFLFLIAWTKPRTQFIAAGLILLGYWLAFALYPAPGPEDYAKAGLAENWTKLQGFAAHWDKNTNFASVFEQWFLNLFPREKPFLFNGGGYLTLSFVPSLATMIFGLIAGGWLRGEKSPMQKFWGLIIAGVAGLAVGILLNLTGICPVVKRIWTPSWAIFAAGWTCLLLAAFYALIDLKGWRGWAFPLVVVGMNSITMYVMSWTLHEFFGQNLKVHLGQNVFALFGAPYAPMVERASTLFILWLILWWMYRRKIFLRL